MYRHIRQHQEHARNQILPKVEASEYVFVSLVDGFRITPEARASCMSDMDKSYTKSPAGRPCVPHPPMIKNSVPASHATRSRSEAGRSPYNPVRTRSTSPGRSSPIPPIFCHFSDAR